MKKRWEINFQKRVWILEKGTNRPVRLNDPKSCNVIGEEKAWNVIYIFSAKKPNSRHNQGHVLPDVIIFTRISPVGSTTWMLAVTSRKKAKKEVRSQKSKVRRQRQKPRVRSRLQRSHAIGVRSSMATDSQARPLSSWFMAAALVFEFYVAWILHTTMISTLIGFR